MLVKGKYKIWLLPIKRIAAIATKLILLSTEMLNYFETRTWELTKFVFHLELSKHFGFTDTDDPALFETKIKGPKRPMSYHLGV